jgi:hypothetical protein
VFVEKSRQEHQTKRRYIMKKFVLATLAAALFMGIGIQNASAANSLTQGTFGLNVEVNSTPMISGKYMLANDLAILAGFGLGIRGADDKGTDILIGVGAHKYLKVADFAPFVGGRIGYASTKDSNVKSFIIQAEGGAEAFLTKQLSLEGKVALGYTHTDSGGAKASMFGTSTAGVSLNYYF